MTIRAEIKVISVVMVLAILLSLGIVTFYFIQAQGAISEMRSASAISTGVARLRFAVVETLLYGGNRPRQQWRLSHQFLADFLNKEQHTTLHKARLLQRMKTQLATLEVFYQRLPKDVPEGAAANVQVRQEGAARTSSEILLTSQSMLDGATELYRINLDQMALAQKLGGALLLSLILVLTALVLWVLALVKKRVLVPLVTFEAGMHEIAAGNLAHRFNLPYANEIGQLGNTFDEMTVRLEDSYSKLSDENALRHAAQLQMQLTNVELEHARDAADAANHAKGVFLANMSHEIRTPLNAVLGMLQLVGKTALNVRQQDYVKKAQSAAKSLLGLLNDILDFSKMSVGKLQLDIHPFELEQLMAELAVILSGAQSSANVEVIFDIDQALPPVLKGDRLRFLQILINLAGNAVKFTQHGQVLIRLVKLAGEADQLTLRVEVSDTGIGVSVDQLERIFEGFTQAEASTTRRFGGTGLGLVISQRLAMMMGSKLLVQSELGRGSRFWFDLTLAIEHTSTLPLIPAASMKALRILVIDDHALSSEILIKTLQEMGWQVDGASSGAAGIACIQRAQTQAIGYDVVMMDWRMPEMDGLAAATRIKQLLPASQSPCIIMMTAFGDEVLVAAAGLPDAPFVDILTKPVTPQQLATVVQKALTTPLEQITPAPTAASAAPRLDGIRILLVEDNALNRQVATELLQAEGAEVAIAEGGLQGVKMATRQDATYDVIIMDVQMPDLDGLEATRRIRAYLLDRQLPILAMTANISETDRANCLAAGMDDHVGKPIDIEEVVAKLLTLLGRNATAATLLATFADEPSNPLVESPSTILKRYGQKTDVYRMALAGFKAEGLRLVAELEAQLRNGNMVHAGATLHAMKGVAATVGAAALTKLATNLERAARMPLDATAQVLFSRDNIAALIDLIERSDATLDATMPPASVAKEVVSGAEVVEFSVAQQIAMLREIQTLLRVGNLRAIDLAEELTASTSQEVKVKVQELLDMAKNLRFNEADIAAQSLIESRH